MKKKNKKTKRCIAAIYTACRCEHREGGRAENSAAESERAKARKHGARGGIVRRRRRWGRGEVF